MCDDVTTLTLGGESFVVPLTFGLIEKLEDTFGSLILVLKAIKDSDVTTQYCVDILKEALVYSNLSVDGDVFQSEVSKNGTSGIVENIILLIAPLVAGISVLNDLEGGEKSLGKLQTKVMA
jgi:hypothetical protein